MKKRIGGDYGHLCNTEAATTLVRLLDSGTKRFMMCHMSKENNCTEALMQTLRTTFDENGCIEELNQVSLANRDMPSEVVVL